MHAAILFVLIYFAFDRLAAALGSTRGEAGLVVAAVVLVFVLTAERWLTRAPLRDCARALGLGPPPPRALLASAGVSAFLLLCLPLLARFAPLELTLRPNAAWVALGIAAPWLFFFLRPRNVRSA